MDQPQQITRTTQQLPADPVARAEEIVTADARHYSPQELTDALRALLGVKRSITAPLRHIEQAVARMRNDLGYQCDDVVQIGMDEHGMLVSGRVEARQPPFPVTYCSQCGGKFGPGQHGFSHCRDHKHLSREG